MDAERLLISKVAQTGRGLSDMVADGITSDLFDDEESADIWDFMVNHELKYGSMASFATIREEHPEYHFEVSNDALNFLKDKFLEARERQLAMQFCTDLSHAVNDPEKAGKLGEYILEAGRDIMVKQPGGKVAKFSEMQERIEKWHEMKKAGNQFGIKIGIPAIDEATLGIQEHEFWAVVGWQGMGKSTLSQWITFNTVGAGKKTLYISLEMSSVALLRKWDTMAVEFESYRNLKMLELSDMDIKKWEAYAAKLKLPEHLRPDHLKGDILILDDVRDCTVERVHAEMNRHKPDIVVIDYMTLMDVPKSANVSRWEGITWLSRQLKQMAISMNTPIIGLAQTARASAKEGAKLDNIGGSYSIGADADVVLGLHQEPDWVEENKPIMRIDLLKNRDGEQRSEKVYWDMKHMRFRGTYNDGIAENFRKGTKLEAVEATESEEQTEVPGEEAKDETATA